MKKDESKVVDNVTETEHGTVTEQDNDDGSTTFVLKWKRKQEV